MDKDVVIFNTQTGGIEVAIDISHDTVWLDKNDIAKLFSVDRSGISRHINNIFKTGEVNRESNVQKMHIPNSDRPVELFSLDVILAVGYRVNSTKAIAFRQWVSQILKQYLKDGYALNEKILQASRQQINKLQNAIELLNRSIENHAKNLDDAQRLTNIMADFALSLIHI